MLPDFDIDYGQRPGKKKVIRYYGSLRPVEKATKRNPAMRSPAHAVTGETGRESGFFTSVGEMEVVSAGFTVTWTE